MKTTKRLLAFVLCFAMLVGMLPMFALRAEAAGTLIDAAIFCSDVHGNPSTVTSVFNGIKSADSTFNPTTASFVGDTQTTASSVTSAAQQVYSGVQCIYAFGNHDDEGDYGIDDFTGLSYGSSSTNYYIYTISENNMSTSSPDTSGFTSTVAGLDKTKPLFIISHMPLHSRRGDNKGAAAWYTAISAAAESMDIFFFWAHNHTSEGSADTAAYYVAKNGSETMTIQGGSTVTPNFTYANAGYIDPPNTPARNNVATAVRIYDDSVNLTVYNASGELSGTYAVNETVTREFAGTTDSGDGEGGSTDETTDPTEGTTAPTEGEEENTTITYNYTATAATDGTGYILVSNGYALQNNGGSISSVAVTVSDDGSTITFADTVDVSTILWTIDSDGDVMNDGYYLLRASGSGTKSMTISTTDSGDAYSNWTYSSDTLTTTGGSGGSTTFYAYCASGTFSTQSSSSQELKFYVPSGDTSSGGGSGDDNTGSGDSGNTGDSTETVVGEATVNTATDGSWQTVTFGTEGEQKTVYVLVSTPTAGKNYIIASGNSAGNVYALKENTTTGTSVTVNAATDSITAPYIENSDNAIVWTASSGMNFKSVNGGYYLNYSSNKGSYSLSFSTSSASDWTAGTNCLYREGTSNDYYLRYNSGWTMGGKNTEYNVYFYEEQTIDTSTSVTYSVTASDIEHFYTADETDTETVTITKSVTEGTPDGTYTYEIVEGGDNIITSIDQSTGVITFNGNEGTAQVKVSYTWAAETDVNEDGTVDANDTYTIWQVIDVTATSPYYTLDLHKAVYTFTEANITEFASDVTYYEKDADGKYVVTTDTAYDSSKTYYTASAALGDEITETIAIKGVEQGDTYSVWAVIKYYDGVVDSATGEDGADLGDVDDTLIEWTSSDTSIATVDPTTGIITFTGKDGTVNITATYLDGNKPSDTVTISVTQSQYTVPNDGTTDFPEYPNEGAIRFDKTATAVGNFSETGIAMVELSMTGVPYTSGSEIDVVVMLDMSTSMDDDRIAATVAATKVFVESIVKNEDGTYNDNRIYVGYFNGDTVYTITDSGNIGGELATVDNDTEYNALIAAIEDEYDGALTASGTNYDVSLEKCYNILTAAKTDGTGNNRDQFVLFMSDGGPTDYATSASNVVAESTVVTWFNVDDSDSANWTNSLVEEYWSGLMKDNGVTIYSVGLILQEEPTSGPQDYQDYSADQNYYVTSTLLTGIASGADYFINCESATDTADMEAVFADIAVKILQAATDVTVEDKITDEYTMIFDIPEGSKDITGVTNDFYIEFLKYNLDATTHERVDSDNDGDTYDDAASVTKLYLKNTDDVYSAASDASGTAYDAPVFAQSTIGEKGTLYFWTTDQTMASKAAVSYNDGTNTYYFIPYGMEANEDGTAPTGWCNMTSGGYAYGTVDSTTNMSEYLVIATPYFVYNASTKMLYWTVDKLDTEEYALRYFLYLDQSATEVGTDDEVDAGTYPTNEHAYITYTNSRGNECQQKFPVPQLTWNGAQVSYVFYLVNSAGQPINKSGQVVDFANATFVTDVFTQAVVWNGDNAVEELNIDYLADELLPDDYKVYDENAKYTIHVYQTADGETVFDYFVIEGSEKNTVNAVNGNTVASVETTKVYNTKAGTKYDDYGVYSASAVGSTFTTTNADGNEVTIITTIQASLDYSDTTVAFAVLWEPYLVEDVVVVDFGLDVLIDVVANDNLQNTVSGIGLGKDAYGTTKMNTGVIATSQLGNANLTTSDGSTISIENENQIRFHQNDMTFQNAVTFYYESKVGFYENSVKKDGYMYSSVTVIPATTIYYEDSFLDLTSFSKGEDGTFTEDTTSKWTTDGTVVNATQDQDRPGESQISAAIDADNVYGYDSAYSEMSKYSLGSAAKISVDANTRGEATFTFYGTGFDVIGLTSNTTGTLTVQVYFGTAASGTAVKTTVVDTYYGYTYTEADGWVTTPSTENALYQVPVIKISGLAYGQYTVKLTAGYASFFDHTTDEGNYDLYLDAIRIYDPTGVVSGATTNDTDNTVSNTYKADEEGWPVYEELRNNVIAAADITAESATINGLVFIDGISETASYADYVSYGPNNELYLAAGQAVVFALDLPASIDSVQLGAKSVGGTAKYVIADASTISVQTDLTGAAATAINTATDMYYDITDVSRGAIVIYCSEGTLSLTNIKLTFTQETEVDSVYYVSYDTIEAVVQGMNTVEPTIEVTTNDAVTEGEVITVTVTTSTNVSAVSVNGTVITTYEVSGESYVWTAEVTAASAGQQTISVVAYDVYGNAYAADDTTVTVVAKTATAEETITTIITTIISNLRKWFGWG